MRSSVCLLTPVSKLSLLLGTQLIEHLWKVHPSRSLYLFRNSLQTLFTLDVKLRIGYACREYYFDHFSPISIIFICIFLFYFGKNLFPGNKVRYPSWYKISDNSGFSIGCHIHVQNLTLIISMSLPDFSFMFFQFIFHRNSLSTTFSVHSNPSIISNVSMDGIFVCSISSCSIPIHCFIFSCICIPYIGGSDAPVLVHIVSNNVYDQLSTSLIYKFK